MTVKFCASVVRLSPMFHLPEGGN